MASWWALIAEKLGANYPPTGSSEQKVAYKLGAYNSPGNSWAAKIASKVGIKFNGNNWTSMIAGRGIFGAAGRTLYYEVVSGGSPLSGGVSGNLFTDTDTFYTAVIGRGVVNIAGVRFDDTDTFYTSLTARTGDLLITASLFTDIDTFYTSIISGVYNLSGTRFDDTDTFYASVIGRGVVNITGTRFDDTDTFYASSVSGTGVAPVNTVFPVVTGTFNDGDTLTTTNGTWTGSPTITYAYQWYFASLDDNGNVVTDENDRPIGVPISGATSSTYVIQAGHGGEWIFCDVTATNGTGSAVASSNAVGPVAGISANRFDDTDTFYTAVIGRGAVNISATRFDDTDTFYTSLVVRLTQSIDATLFTDTDTFYTSVVGRGAVNISGTRFDDTDTFYTSSVANLDQPITASLFTDTDTFYTSVVGSGVVNISGTRFDDTDTFYTSVVGSGAVNVSGTRFDDTDVFYTSTVGVHTTRQYVLSGISGPIYVCESGQRSEVLGVGVYLSETSP